jgi:enoyl-CoA hydratase
MKNLITNIENGILTITINRPDKLNALNTETIAELNKVFIDAEDDAEVKGIILTGAGPKAFVAGADISEFIGLSSEAGMELSEAGHDVFDYIEVFPKPVIAAVNGFALGGGCELAMACHIRVASDNAKFGQPEVKLGLIPGYGGTQRLIQLIGKGRAMEYLMTADTMTAEQAERWGLVNYVTTPETLIPKCYELLNKILANSPVAIDGIVVSVNNYFVEGIDGFGEEIEEFGKCFGSDDFKEGTAAFLEKRKPNFKGK